MCVDITDNELAYLECIHLFVEILDHFFSNVCELDLVFNFHKVGPPMRISSLDCCPKLSDLFIGCNQYLLLIIWFQAVTASIVMNASSDFFSTEVYI